MTITTNKKILESTLANNTMQDKCTSSNGTGKNHLFGIKKKNNKAQKNQSKENDNLKQQQTANRQSQLRAKFNHINMINTGNKENEDTSQLIKSRSQSSISRESSIASSDTDDTDEGVMITSSSNHSNQSSSDLSCESLKNSSSSSANSSGSSTPNELYSSGEDIEENEGLNKLIKDIRFNFLERNNLLHLMQPSKTASDRSTSGHNEQTTASIKSCQNNLEFYLQDVLVLIERDFLIKRYIDPKDPNVDISVKALEDLFNWRRSIGLRDWDDATFPVEFYTMNGMFICGLDKQNMPVMYMRAKAHRQWTPKLDELFKNFVAYQVNKITKLFHYEDDENDNSKQQQVESNEIIADRGTFTVCFDCRGATYSSLDMDFLRFLVKLLVNYYPQSCKYAIVVDLPWIFRSVWRLVKTWLPADCQETVKFVPIKQLIEFIEADNIPACMQATPATNSNNNIDNNNNLSAKDNHKHQKESTAQSNILLPKWEVSWPIPDKCKSVTEFDVGLSQSQLKALMAHIEKLNSVV